MSWFDTTGIANFAKTALKEAQKQIDKALDIEDEQMTTSSSMTNSASSGNLKKLPGVVTAKSKTEPNTPSSEKPSDDKKAKEAIQPKQQQQQLMASTWGSFTGSFFENPNAKEMVTTAPRATHSASSIDQQPSVGTAAAKRNSVTSISDSVELLSPTDAATPTVSDVTMNVSESVEVIDTTNASEVTTPEEVSPLPSHSALDDNTTTTDSIVIIDGSNDSIVDDEEDSLSYNTVMDDTLTPNTSTIVPSSQSMISVLNASKMQASDDASTHSGPQRVAEQSAGKKRAHSGEEPIDSDSTQSFEEVQMLSGSLYSQNSSKEMPIDDDKFDVSKITSLASSPHNSNDEAETRTTTTSSDIEIISNPNGDSSSTHSASGRFSNIKLKKFEAVSVTPAGSISGYSTTTSKKGHCREPSEISILSEDSQSEVEKLLSRISELNEQLEAREAQILQCERQNAALHEHNSELQGVVDTLRNNTSGMDPASEDYTQRLSALEKKFQASIRERDALRIQINALKDDLRSKIPRDELEQVKAESDTIVAELRLEGEKLSKEILQQSNIIKKLRAKEKSSDGIIKRNTAQIDDMNDELERLKKTLNAKEEVERTQIEAVHKISSEKRKLEEEHAQQRSKIEDLEMKLATLQASFDAVKGELQQRSKMQLDLSRTADEALSARKEIEALKSENEALTLQLHESREKLRLSESALLKRESQLREENRQLLSRLEAAELRAEHYTEEVTLTHTMPLMRQLESLQNALSQRTAAWNKEEKILLEKLETSQSRLKSLENVEVTYKEKLDLLQARCMELEEKLSGALRQVDQAKIALQQVQIDSGLKEENLNSQNQKLKAELQEHVEKITKLEGLNKSLEDQLHSMKATAAALNLNKRHLGEHHSSTDDLLQRKLNESLTSSLGEVAANASISGEQQQQVASGHSPPNSVGFNSLEDAMGGGNFDWQVDDSDCISNSGGRGGALALMGGLSLIAHNNTSTLEHLQSLLKQRDGELHQLQWEVSRMQAERCVLNEEISNVTIELENLKEKLQSSESLEKSYAELQHRYDALLQMYGEKVERTEELELDLFELKEAYKIQIEEVLAKTRNTP